MLPADLAAKADDKPRADELPEGVDPVEIMRQRAMRHAREASARARRHEHDHVHLPDGDLAVAQHEDLWKKEHEVRRVPLTAGRRGWHASPSLPVCSPH